MRIFSLKWKLSLSFILMALSFVGLYVVLAKKTFESDKISYIFESQQKQVVQLARTFDQLTERVLFDAQAILLGFDYQSRRLNSSSQKVFWDHPKILAMSFRAKESGLLSIKLEKSQGLLDGLSEEWPAEGTFELTPLGNDRYAIETSQNQPNFGPIKLQVVFEARDVLGGQFKGQLVTLSQNGRLLKRSPGSPLEDSSVQKALSSMPAAETTLMLNVGSTRQLVSVANTNIGHLIFGSFTAEDAALGALGVLFSRSIVFLFFSFFATIIISLLLSNRLTQNINSLTQTAERIGGGDFSATPGFTSRDEVGILAKAFAKMSAEIQRLLSETVDKTRMEEELKTARLVQESLFPERSEYENGHVRLFGMNKATTECSGDWWFYYQKGAELYVLVADATGHGIPAALITAAARSIFSFLERTEASLTDVVTYWDRATFKCSKGQVYMTTFLMRINVETGEAAYINCGHEAPVLLRPKPQGGFEASYLFGQQNFSIGESRTQWLEDRFDFHAGDRLLIYTDGLLAVKSREGRSYSEKRFLSLVQKTMTATMKPKQFAQFLDQHFMELNEGQLLPDDITLLSLDFRAQKA